MRQDVGGGGQETCQHCGRLLPSLINIFIFKVKLQLLGSVGTAAPKTRDVFCVVQGMPLSSNTYNFFNTFVMGVINKRFIC